MHWEPISNDSGNNIVVKVSPNGVSMVVAGNGFAGFSGDGGVATGASLNVPLALAVDSAGNLYLADAANFRIRKVSNGLITAVENPRGLAVRGNLYISDYYVGVCKVSNGIITTFAALYTPRGLAVDSAGILYIADWGNNQVLKVSGTTITVVVGNGASMMRATGAQRLAPLLIVPMALPSIP